ncbi:hypothetical protein JM658_16865 [Joostella atrarenae]|uniref:Tail specific protease domain-containing protein n=1 Tax=Joostella atrarenae TaxID=679257 RepID=A0ABS9J7U2_9FLAO|nr:S41 family peptidase [Joostella atrarenae]MCF8716496.1 hypothetical protein [Joostella atrarenae]
MKSIQLFFFSIFLCCISCSQQSGYNLGFEELKAEESLPKYWFKSGDYHISNDSLNHVEGKNAVMISSTDNSSSSSYGYITLKLPESVRGEQIKLEGYMKTENVDGGAGLFLKIERFGKSLEFDNMFKKGIQGTTNWQKYEIHLPNHENATDIYIGGILKGKGTVWFDNFKVLIDGKDYSKLVNFHKSDYSGEINEQRQIIEDTIVRHKNSEFKMSESPSPEQQLDLYLLGKEWGCLKYFNQEVASGKYNWDYELFKLLPYVGSDKFLEKLNKWKSNFEANDKTVIKSNYYVKFTKSVGNPIFTNEPVYPDMEWDDDGYKLLSLFRFWNIIEYFHPSKYLINDWDYILKQYIPKFMDSDNELEYKLTVLELIHEIKDTHSNIIQLGDVVDKYFGTRTPPFKVIFVEDKLVINEIFDHRSSLKKGDVILQIDGENVNDLINKIKPYSIGSNIAAQKRNICSKILRTNSSSVVISTANGKKVEIRCVSQKGINKFYNRKIPSNKIIDNNIGYIYTGSLKKGEINSIIPKFIGKEGLIFDLRCYPSDFLPFQLGAYLYSEPKEFVKFSIGSVEKPGIFTFTDPLITGFKNPDYYKGRIAVLVNEFTQSQAEYTVMAIQVTPKVKVIGSQTAGADGNVSKIYLPGNISTMISGIGVYYPSGKQTQGIGIIPDISVKNTIEAVKANKDIVLERAIKYIQTGK